MHKNVQNVRDAELYEKKIENLGKNKPIVVIKVIIVSCWCFNGDFTDSNSSTVKKENI